MHNNNKRFLDFYIKVIVILILYMLINQIKSFNSLLHACNTGKSFLSGKLHLPFTCYLITRENFKEVRFEHKIGINKRL